MITSGPAWPALFMLLIAVRRTQRCLLNTARELRDRRVANIKIKTGKQQKCEAIAQRRRTANIQKTSK